MEIDVEVGLKLAASTNKLSDELGKANRERRWIPRSLSAQLTATGAGTFAATFGAPADGRLWNPVALAIVGAPPTFAIAQLTRAAFCIGDFNNPTPSQVVAMLEGTTANAFSATFGTEALWSTNTEDCFVQAVAAGAVGLVVNLRVREYRQDDIMPRFL